MFVDRISRLWVGLSRGGGKHVHFIVTVWFIAAVLGLALLPAQSLQAADCQAQHTVKAGETLAKIAQQYPVTWTQIAQANNLANANYIYAGQVLCIPAATTTPPATCVTQHVVKYGETLHRIALAYGLSWPVVAQANNLPNPNTIYVGQRLCIPSSNTPQPPPPPPPGPVVGVIPTFAIVSVVANQSVTIRTSNFPANEQFEVRMGLFGSQGVNGTYVTNTGTNSGGSFTATYTIPANLRNLSRIAIRMQSASGYYSYNWFYNNTTP